MARLSVVVVGAGIVGLAIAFHLYRDGAEVTVVDRDPEGDKASLGNAGGIAVTEVVPAAVPGLVWKLPGWLIDPLGPLAVRPRHAPRLIPWLRAFARAGRPREVAQIAAALAALNRRVYDDLLPMLAETGLSGELHRRGALTVYTSERARAADRAEWALKRAHGVEAAVLTGQQARALEPALGPAVRCAVFAPQWSHVSDPKRIVDGLRRWLQASGTAIVAGTVERIHDSGAGGAAAVLRDGRTVVADGVVVAAGAWSGRLAAELGDRVLLESERGYNITIAAPGIALGREVIFAERKFVATPLSCGLRIGGAAEFGGLDAPPNFRRSDALAALASLYLPGLRRENGTRWAGHRPATPDSLPVIGRSPGHPRVVYAFGHGHLGLTQAATTGRLVADLMLERSPAIDLGPYAIARFA
jgi:D-amino-acid dehydrogenase